MTLSRLCACALFFVLTGCSDRLVDHELEVGDPSLLMPVTEGTTWTYRTTVTRADEPPEVGRTIVRVTGEEEIEKVPYALLEEQWSGTASRAAATTISFARNVGEGLAQWDAFVSIKFVYRYPAKPGTFYTMPSVNGSRQHIDVAEETIDVPAGRFACQRYTILDTYDGSVRVEHFAPGIGLVRRSDATTTMELVDYALQNPRPLSRPGS